MIDLHLDNPYHDLASELLLSVGPTPIRAVALARDMTASGAETSIDDIREMVRKLRNRGHLIRMDRRSGYTWLYVEPGCQGFIDRACRTYLAQLKKGEGK